MNFLISFLTIIIALFLIFIGYKVIFNPQQFIDFYIKSVSGKNPKNIYAEKIIKMTGKKSYKVNLIIFGVLAFLFGFLLIFAAIHSLVM